ncbi:hypothetical protein BDY17DRAFT_29239 [Neohortaea acidophila]|uniref:Uncharacterized protein n=1 Tax=Neohortaea acidophila TaxID=245834 RepID=A0A6A6PJU8_9PEZI|nr:uncharacterized protein BDY17DRAFT_29239 [Neohortaea acidophila]KAF2479954.1 hypothetical protein BDY17DRAFT_29239 [Neohortaea acidophila]
MGVRSGARDAFSCSRNSAKWSGDNLLPSVDGSGWSYLVLQGQMVSNEGVSSSLSDVQDFASEDLMCGIWSWRGVRCQKSVRIPRYLTKVLNLAPSLPRLHVYNTILT